MSQKVSVITPVYNGKYVTKTIDSVFNQTVKPLEYCICVDGNEETFNKIFSYFQEKGCMFNKGITLYTTDYKGIKIKIRNREINLGIGATLNDCILMTEGDLIAWVSADDQMTPNRLEFSLKEYELLGCPKDKVIYGDYNLLDLKSNTVYHRVRGISFKNLEEEKIYVMNSCFVNFSTTLIPRETFKKVGLFAPIKRFGEDYEWLMRAIVVGDIFIHYIPEVLVNYGVDRETQATHKNINNIPQVDLDSKKRVLDLLKNTKIGGEKIEKYFPELK